MMRSPSRYILPGVILPVKAAPEKKMMYQEIISELRENFTDRDFVEQNWWDIIMPSLNRHGFKFTLKDMAIVLLVLRKKAIII